MRLVVLALLVGCGGKPDPTRACANAAQHGVDAMTNEARKRLASASLPEDMRTRILARQKKLEGAGATMKAVLTKRCVADKWTDAVIACYAKVTSPDDMLACRAQLSPEQQAALHTDEVDLAGGPADDDEQK